MQELEREQAEVAEIEASDQEYLNDLKVSIAEQKCVDCTFFNSLTNPVFSIEVEALRAELSEHTEQLNYLQGRLQELAAGEKEATDAITKAQHVLQMKENSTRAEVFRLRGLYQNLCLGPVSDASTDELETLEDLHRFHITKVDENSFEYIYASHFKVVIPCTNFRPISSKVDIIRVGNMTSKPKDDFPKLSHILFQAAITLVRQSKSRSCKEVNLVYNPPTFSS